MEGSISEISKWPKPESNNKEINQERAQSFARFTFAISAEDRQLLEMHDFAGNFPNSNEFEIQLQQRLEAWTNKDKPDDGFWLNKPA